MLSFQAQDNSRSGYYFYCFMEENTEAERSEATVLKPHSY